MKLVDIIRFSRGYVNFTATGGFPERFINLCNVNGIRLWNLEPDINNLKASVSASKFIKLRKYAKRSGVKIKIDEKNGLPFIIKKHRYRMLIPIGAVLFVLFIFIMNQFVWIIEITGTQSLSHEGIASIAELYGLRAGAFVPNLDEASISRSCVNHFGDRIVWMAVNIKGSKAVIEVRDFKEEREDSTYGDPCNIIADFEGKILSIETFNGDREVTAGSGVKIGDLLISGVIENSDMSCDYLEARGKITALHTVSFNRRYNKSDGTAKVINIADKYYGFKFLWADIYLKPIDKINSYSYGFSKNMVIEDTKLPFGISDNIIYSLSPSSQEKNYFLYALDNYISDLYYSFRNTNILDIEFSIADKNNEYVIEAQSDCIDFIGIKSEILVSK